MFPVAARSPRQNNVSTDGQERSTFVFMVSRWAGIQLFRGTALLWVGEFRGSGVTIDESHYRGEPTDGIFDQVQLLITSPRERLALFA